MSSTKQIKYRDAAGNETLMNIAVDAVNVESNTFTPATTRVNLVSGEKLPTIFGKIMRWFADLKAVAFTGSYTDLSSKPSLGTASGYAVANNDTTNNASYLSTAAVAYQHGREIDRINSDLSARLPGGTGIQWDGANFWGTTTAGVKKKLGDCQKLKTIEVKINSTWGGGSVNTILHINVIYNGDNITSVTGEVKWNSDGPNTAVVNSFSIY